MGGIPPRGEYLPTGQAGALASQQRQPPGLLAACKEPALSFPTVQPPSGCAATVGCEFARAASPPGERAPQILPGLAPCPPTWSLTQGGRKFWKAEGAWVVSLWYEKAMFLWFLCFYGGHSLSAPFSAEGMLSHVCMALGWQVPTGSAGGRGKKWSFRTKDLQEPLEPPGKSRAAVAGETLNPSCGNSRGAVL